LQKELLILPPPEPVRSYLDNMDGLKLFLIFLILFGVGMSIIALLDDRKRARKASAGRLI